MGFTGELTMNTAILVIIAAPFALALIWSAMTVFAYRADPPPPQQHGESQRQKELLERALELRGEVPDELWPLVTPASRAATRERKAPARRREASAIR